MNLPLIEQQPSTQPETDPVASTPNQSLWLNIEAYIERMFILLCIYTLSVGPMYWDWLAGRQAKGNPYIAAFYEPLRIAGELFPPFGEWLNWYIRFWIL